MNRYPTLVPSDRVSETRYDIGSRTSANSRFITTSLVAAVAVAPLRTVNVIDPCFGSSLI